MTRREYASAVALLLAAVALPFAVVVYDVTVPMLSAWTVLLIVGALAANRAVELDAEDERCRIARLHADALVARLTVDRVAPPREVGPRGAIDEEAA